MVNSIKSFEEFGQKSQTVHIPAQQPQQRQKPHFLAPICEMGPFNGEDNNSQNSVVVELNFSNSMQTGLQCKNSLKRLRGQDKT